MSNKESRDYEYDVCLSFAGEDRCYVSEVASHLRENGIRVFYDEYQELELWGKDLYVHLDDVYKNSARYCVMFASKHYAKKLWTNHERQSAQERAFKENTEYVLPARFDDTPIPGLRDTVGYIELSDKEPSTFAEQVIKKVGGHFKNNYFPPTPDSLYASLEIPDDDEEAKDEVFDVAYYFFSCLKRMSEEERELIFCLFIEACPAELPDNVHMNIDLLRRETNFSPAKIMRLLKGMNSLGFEHFLRDDNETGGHVGNEEEMLVVEWDSYRFEGSTEIAYLMINLAMEGYCLDHAMEALSRLDFSQLSKATYEEDRHH